MHASLNPAELVYPRLRGHWLALGRVVWIGVAALTLGLFVIGLPYHHEGAFHYRESDPAVLHSLGLSPTSYPIYNTLMDVLTVVVFAGVGTLLFWRKSDDRMAFVASMLLMTWGVVTATGALDELVIARPDYLLPVNLVKAFGDITLVWFIYTLPDGGFAPDWTRWVVAAFSIWTLAYTLLPENAFVNPHTWPDLLRFAVPFAVYIGALPVQRYRFRRVLTPVQKQQAKWIVAGFVAALLGFIAANVPEMTIPALQQTGVPLTLYRAFLQAFLLVTMCAIPVTIAFSAQHYRLWDIDRLINRSLAYGALALVLAGFFLLAALAFETLLNALTGQHDSSLGYAGAAVAVGISFQPLLRRLQAFVDRRVFRLRVDPRRITTQPRATFAGTVVATSVGQYRVGELIARGGMGEVYRGEHPTLQRPVAIKILGQTLSENAEFLTRFEREALLVAKLRHPNIVTVYDYGRTGSTYYMVMEYIDGRELRDKIRDAGPMPLDEVRRVVRDIAAALDYAHAQGLVHRDVKPSNIMLQPVSASGGDGSFRAILLDFGLARIVEGSTGLTQTGLVGTLEYVSPEQIIAAREVDGRADIYALGVVLYEMLTGEPPFQSDGNVGALLFAHIQQPPLDPRTLRPDLPPHIAQAVLRALEKAPDARFSTAGELAAALG